MSITRNQSLALAGVVLSVIVSSTAYFTDMFGAQIAKEITGTAGFLNLLVNGVIMVFSGQGQQVRDVQAMPGIDRITVNANANQTLAQVATDPSNAKVAPIPMAADAVKSIAKGA